MDKALDAANFDMTAADSPNEDHKRRARQRRFEKHTTGETSPATLTRIAHPGQYGNYSMLRLQGKMTH